MLRIDGTYTWGSLVLAIKQDKHAPGSGDISARSKEWLYGYGWYDDDRLWNTLYIQIKPDVQQSWDVHTCQRVSALSLRREKGADHTLIGNATCSSGIGVGRFYRLTNVPTHIYNLVTVERETTNANHV